MGNQTNLISIKACQGRACRVVVSERNDLLRQQVATPIERLRYRLSGRADRVTANSQGTLAALGAWVPAEKLRFTPNPLHIPYELREGPPPPSLRNPCSSAPGVSLPSAAAAVYAMRQPRGRVEAS